MKDILISSKRQKTELYIFAGCIIAAFIMNVISIIVYKTEWSELWTQALWMLIITCGFYALTIAFRILLWLIRHLSIYKK
ncbi:MAG: hypothetical protein PHG06_00820 [Parabacteroides sp.]|jgi:ABC-type Fe3+-siderophore transport system permease subunit|nr:hypothetical protein [Parabacteroides sp.]